MSLSKERFERLVRQPAVLLFGAGVLLLIFSGWLWWAKVFTGPRTVFDGMLARNLSTSAVIARQISTQQEGVKVDKRSEIQYGAHNLVHITATTTVPAQKAEVRTETVATPTVEYNRYTGLKLAGNTQADTAKLLQKWAKSPAGKHTAYTQTLLRPYGFPMGNLSAPDRHTLLDYLHDNAVFQTDYAVQRGSLNGRPTYTYNVKIQPVAYIAFIKGYAKLLGFNDLDDVDPGSAHGAPAVPVKLTVDVRSRRMVKAEYGALGFTETYSDYNLARSSELPKPTISVDQLQQLVANLR